MNEPVAGPSNAYYEYREAIVPSESAQSTNADNHEETDSIIADVRFVCLENPLAADQELLSQVFKMLKESNVDGVRWVAEKDLFGSGHDRAGVSAIYVVHPFSGPAFELLTKRNCSNIYGPRCIQTCLQQGWPLPRNPHRPIANLALKKVDVCCSNMTGDQRKDMHFKIEAMGGKSRKELSQSVTHLVAPTVGSKKYFMANITGKHVVTPEWVDEMWKLSSSGQVDCDTLENLEKYRLPIFKGCVITISQLPQEIRTKLKKEIEKYGGTYQRELVVNVTTHVVCTVPEGDKYSYATKWGLPVVNPDWIHNSVKSRYCVDWVKYLINRTRTPDHIKQGSKGQRATSTPQKGAARLDHSLNISAIPGTCAPVPISHPKGSALAAIQEDIRENNILAEDTVLGRRISNESIKQRRPNLRCSETAANTQDLKAGFPTDNMNGKPETADKKPDQPIPGENLVVKTEDVDGDLEEKPSLFVQPQPLAKRILALEPETATQKPSNPCQLRADLLKAMLRDKPAKPAPRGHKRTIQRNSSPNKRGCLVWSQAERNPLKDRLGTAQLQELSDSDEPMDLDDDDDDMNGDFKVEIDENDALEDSESPSPPLNAQGIRPNLSKQPSRADLLRSDPQVSGVDKLPKFRSADQLPPAHPLVAVKTAVKAKSADNIPITRKNSEGTKKCNPALPTIREAVVEPVGAKTDLQRMGSKVQEPMGAKKDLQRMGPKVHGDVIVVGEEDVAEIGKVNGVGKTVDEVVSKAVSVAPQAPADPPLESPQPSPMVFCLSGVSADSEKKRCFSIIKQLGGTYIDSVQYEPTCTHLLIKVPNRNEKFLGCCAAGKWILHMKFIDDSFAAGHFLPETMYEWGNYEYSKAMNGELERGVKSLAVAAFSWRTAVTRSRVRAFEGWKVLLAADKARSDGYSRLLKAGGAIVLTDRPPYTLELMSHCSHFFHEINKVPVSEAILDHLKDNDVAYHPAEYLATCLIDESPNPSREKVTSMEVSAPQNIKGQTSSTSSGTSGGSSTKTACSRVSDSEMSSGKRIKR